MDLKTQIYGALKTIERHEKNIRESKEITERNKQLIFEFKDFCSALGNSKHRLGIVLRNMYIFGRLIETDFDKATRKDIEKAMSKLNESHYGAWSRQMVKQSLKRFYRWLNNLESTDALPDCVKWVKGKSPPNMLKKEDLVTEEEVVKMLESTPQLMYKALMSVLYESAMRPGELLQMQIKDVHFDRNYATIYVRGKMAKSSGDRKIYLIRSYDILMKWLQSHPFRQNKEHPVWIVSTRQVYKKKGLYGKALSLAFLSKLLKNCARKAGVQKRVYPYLFRHSRGTRLYIELGESMAKKQMGHVPDSGMAKTYNHMNEEDVLEKLKEIHGIKEPEKEGEKSEACHKCGHPNQFGADMCGRCGLSLNLKTAMAIEQENRQKDEQLQLMKQILDSFQKNPKAMKLISDPEFIEQEAEKRAKVMFEEWVKTSK